MNRRQYLAAIAGVACTSVAGCTALADETVLEAPAEQHEGQSVYYRYEHDGKEVLRVSFNTQPETAAIQRLRVYIEQPGDTTLDNYRFRFKPDTSTEASADIYLHPPRLGHSDEFDTYHDADWTVVSGEYEGDRRVTTRFDMLVYGGVQNDAVLSPLLIDYEVILSGDGVFGDTFIARDQQTMNFRDSA